VPFQHFSPSIYMTKTGSTGQSDLATSNGAHAFLVKSLISGDDLDRVISKALAAIGPHKERPFYT